jgi:uncharacterized Zn-finger protein
MLNTSVAIQLGMKLANLQQLLFMVLIMPELSQSSTKRYLEISSHDLPFCCPLKSDRLWDAHPRVYLPITKTGHVTCPYCGTKYFLKKIQ